MRFTPAFPLPCLAHILCPYPLPISFGPILGPYPWAMSWGHVAPGSQKTRAQKPANPKTRSINSSFIVLVRPRFKFSVQDGHASARDFVANGGRNLPRQPASL